MTTPNQEIQSAIDLKSAIDNSVIGGEFAFNNCDDIHIGPKYENSNNIVINQNISVSSEVLDCKVKSAITEELQRKRRYPAIIKGTQKFNFCM